ncbi:putative Oxidoreductase-like domain-containing protein [Septoria linicola]|nr:putative Oxidoreductase-like domain-containing protein [Septoria linicola]
MRTAFPTLARAVEGPFAVSRVSCPRPWLQIRRFRVSSRNNDLQTQPKPAAFPGYERDALDAPLHGERQHVDRPYADPSPEDLYPMTTKEAEKTATKPQADDSTIARAKRVFGDRELDAIERKRLAESQSRLIAGVLVPPKPEEPDNCCMSGCVNCVWERFREELEEFALKMKEAKTAQNMQRLQGQATGLMSADSSTPAHVAISMDDDGGGSETLWNDAVPQQVAEVVEGGAGGIDEDPLAGVPIGIREFMRTEKKLKEMHKQRGEKIETALDTELRPAAWSTSTRTPSIASASPR